MKAHLTHELSRYKPALFEHSVMRKTAKSALSENLESRVDTFDISVFSKKSLFVFDGRNILHCVVLPKECTHNSVITEYCVSYVDNTYGSETLVFLWLF